MPPELNAALQDGLAWLLDRSRQQEQPETAVEQLAGLQAHHPGLDIDLVWDKEDYSGAVHYDLLIRVEEAGTVSLSFCPDRATPWPLRNAFRSPDDWIVRVNGRVIDAQTAMTTLDVVWDRVDLVHGLVNLGLIDDAVTRRGLKVSDGDLQAAMVTFRRKHGLLTRESTLRFLEEKGMTQRDLERRLESQALGERLRDEIARGKVDAYFEAHAREFDTAQIARFRMTEESAAQRIADEIRSGARDFFAAAQDQFLAGTHSGATFVTLRRGSWNAAVVFAASTGEIVVMPSGNGYDVARVLRIDGAQLNDATRVLVRQAIFEEWLAGERKSAEITWFWGDPVRLQSQNNGWA